jgi:hypothetical protein
MSEHAQGTGINDPGYSGDAAKTTFDDNTASPRFTLIALSGLHTRWHPPLQRDPPTN